jgi:opacity protein-like surface antigen
MRKLIAMCAIAIVSMTLAQTADAGRFGIKAGTNVTSMDFKAGMPPVLGYSAGITWQWNLPLGFAIQPDLLYHVKASQLSEINQQTFGLGYVELPVNIQWGLRFAQKNVRVFAQASPFIGYAVTQTGTVDRSGMDKWTDINRFSYGAGLGVGIQLWALQVTAQYTWNLGKLSNVKNTSISDFNDKNFGGYVITAALMFGKKKDKKN